ncbi:MAG: rhodanese-like domain-containing protein [Candidatus Puniceispirillaceae bacterium]
MTKTAMGSLEEANKIVPRLSPQEAIAKHGADNVVIIDVRDGKDIDGTGTIKGALRIPRGFIEFAADETTDFHNPALQKDKEILVVCAAGGMAALTGQTLTEMGYSSVYNIGGFSAWKDAGGPTES